MHNKYSHGVMPMSFEETSNDSPGRQKMSNGVTTSEDLDCEYKGGDADDASSFNNADGVEVGLQRRSPMNTKSKHNDAMGVNHLSRSKYDGS